MMHDYHEGLAGYIPSAILQDGCGECERRAGLAFDHQWALLDQGNRRRAVQRAVDWAGSGTATPVIRISSAEAQLLRNICTGLDAATYKFRLVPE